MAKTMRPQKSKLKIMLIKITSAAKLIRYIIPSFVSVSRNPSNSPSSLRRLGKKIFI
ncbi:hypothetical protein [Methanobrevibacter arboriphilus]|uniref:hypothetical protein n=1 Tax=Methanobrevibacter arboriphilus TaxID=39441 RepID=UPI001CDB08E3|nr:hypothetical protein [Methanobrevibacter arboriphilus]